IRGSMQRATSVHTATVCMHLAVSWLVPDAVPISPLERRKEIMSVHSQFSGNPSPLRALAARIEADDFDAHANAASGAPASRKEEARSMVGFADLGLVPQLVSAVSKAGFRSPTEVQARCIPEALAGYDLMVSAQTGSGKTAAFMLAALHRLVQAGPEQGV